MNVFVVTAIIGMMIFFALYAALAIGAVMLAVWIGKKSKEEQHGESIADDLQGTGQGPDRKGH